MGAKRQNIQLLLAFDGDEAGEARGGAVGGIEAPRAAGATEDPAPAAALMEEVCDREDLKRALQRVKSNKGSAGVDGMTSPRCLTWSYPKNVGFSEQDRFILDDSGARRCVRCPRHP